MAGPGQGAGGQHRRRGLVSWAGAARRRARRRRLHAAVYTQASTLHAGLYTQASTRTRLHGGVYTARRASPLTVVAALDRVEVLLAHGARRGSAWLGGRRLSWSLDWRDTGARPRRGRWRHQHGALGDVLTPATLASMLRRLVMLLMARRAHQHGARACSRPAWLGLALDRRAWLGWR